MKTTIGRYDNHLHAVPAFALLGGVATYLLVPVATELPALATLALASILLWALIAYDTRSYGEARHQVRRPEAETA